VHGHAPHLDRLQAYRGRQQGDRVRYRRLETRWSALRLIIFVAGIAAAVLLRHDPRAAGLAGMAGGAAFAGAIWRHMIWQNRRVFVEHLLTVVEESLHASTRRDRPPRTWQRPEDPADSSAWLPVVLEPGPTWLLTQQEQDDLDLYGPPVGIFGLLNRTSTRLGARRLRDRLDSLCLSGAHIRQRQRAVRWLDTHEDQRLGLMAAFVPLREHTRHLDDLVSLLPKVEPPPRSTVSKGVKLWSVFSGLIFLYGVLRIGSGDYVWISYLGALLAVNIGIRLILHRRFRRLSALASPWTPLRDTLNRILAAAQHASAELPDEAPLGLLREHFHIRDDLAKNESYFLSEVRRLRRLVLDDGKDTPILGLIDEPFRGTNSQERTAAGLALLEHLTASPNLFLIATHEDLLAHVAAATASAANYHFQEHLDEGGITFDYQLRPGPTATRTALRILEREGYPNSLLERARRFLAGGTQDLRSG